MKTGIAAIGIVIIIIIAVGAYYVARGSGSRGLATYSTLTQYSTVQYGTTALPNASTTTVKQNATTTAGGASYTVNIAHSSSLGSYLTDGRGYALYYFTSDKAYSGTSGCNGGCASAWPPFYTAVLGLPQNLSASNFNTITRNDGAKQLAYNGLPLYYFQSDTQPGQVNGNGVGGFVVAGTAPH